MIKTAEDIKRIKKLIQDSEVTATKAQGVIDNLEAKWKEQFGEGTLAAAKSAYVDLQAKIEKQEAKREALCKELDDLYDWDSLED